MRVKPEEKLQMAIVQYIKLCAPQCIVFAIRNEGNRGIIGNKIAVAMGLLSGLHDLCILNYCEQDDCPGGYWEPHFLEVKTPGGPVSAEQRAVHADFSQRGIKHRIVRSVDDASAALAYWGIETIENRAPPRQENIDGAVRA